MYVFIYFLNYLFCFIYESLKVVRNESAWYYWLFSTCLLFLKAGWHAEHLSEVHDLVRNFFSSKYLNFSYLFYNMNGRVLPC